MLFSIEVTSTYYPLNTYASAFKCAIVGALVFRYFWFDTSYIPVNFDFESWAYAEIPWFIILGRIPQQRKERNDKGKKIQRRKKKQLSHAFGY